MGLLSDRLRQESGTRVQDQYQGGGLLSSRLRRLGESEAPELEEEEQEAPGPIARGFSWVAEQLSRGTYGGAEMIHSYVENVSNAMKEEGAMRKAVAFMTSGLRATAAGIQEVIHPTIKRTTSDLLKEYLPDWTKENPKSTALLGFVGDIAVDPTTYLSFGTSTALRPAKVAVGLDRRLVGKLMEEAGVKASVFDRLGSLVGKAPSAEKALAFESNAALNRAVVAQRGKIVRDFHSELAALTQRYGSPAAALDNPRVAIEEAQKEFALAQDKLSFFEKSANRKVKNPDKIMARERTRVELQEKVRTAKEKADQLANNSELTSRIPQAERFQKQEAAFRESQRLFNGTLPEGLAPKGARDVRRAKLAEETTRLQAEMQRRIFTLDETHKALAGKTFKSGKELEGEIGKLIGAEQTLEVVWDGPYQRMARLFEDPAVIERVRDRGGIKLAGRTVVSGEVLSRAAEVTGFNRVTEMRDKFRHFLNETAPAFRGRNTPIVQELTQMVKMPDGTMRRLGEAYVDARRQYESLVDAADNIAFKDTTERFFKLEPDSKEKLGRLMWDLDDIASGKGAGEGLGAELRVQAAQQRISAARLTDDEHAAFRAYDSTMKEIAAVEKEMGLLDHIHENYFARYFKPTSKSANRAEALRQEAELRNLNRGLLDATVPGGKLGAAKERVFSSVDQAKAAGFDPVFDMAASYALRLTQHRRALARDQFRQTLLHMFPDAKEIPGKAGEVAKLVGVPKEIARDLRFMGDGVYPPDAWGMGGMLRKYDKVMSVWRRGATVVRPSFGVRQGVSNTLQMALISGMRGLDPRAAPEAFSLLAGRGSDMQVTSLLGEKILGSQLLDEANRLGILRGVTVEGIGPGSNPRWQQKLTRALNNAALARNGGDNAVTRGLTSLVNGSFRYTDMPAVVENFSRFTGYINARRMGNSAEESAKMVDKALFDYMHGLNQFETRVVKRLVPFYTYQRFALPMLASVLAHTPGRITNMAKATDGFLKAWGSISADEELNDSERRVLPGWLLEQPAAFRGFNESMKAVHQTYNNFTPLDVLSLMAPGGGDNPTDREVGEMVRKTGMAQIAPWIKIPVELWVAREDMFSGRSLEGEEEGAPPRKIGPTSAASAASWAGAAIMQGATQDTRLAALAGLAGQTEPVQALMQTLLGWEEGIDPDTGERTTYVSPWRFHVATSAFPALADAFKIARDDRPVSEKALRSLFGVNTIEMDLQEEQDRRLRENEQAVRRQDRRVRVAEERELYRRAAEAQTDLMELLGRIEQEETAMSQQPIRGGS